MKRISSILYATILALVVVSCNSKQETLKKDVILIINADIITMNPDKPTANAMAIEGDRIIAIGTENEVRSSINGYNKFYDLQGRTVTPGFIESHDHLVIGSSSLDLLDISPFHTPTLKGALEKLRTVAPNEDGWVLAFGADQTLYEECRGPLREELDLLFPNTPVMIFHLSGHGGFANSEAFRIAGVDKNTPNPEGGFLEKDENGELTGYLGGQPALYMVTDFPAPTTELIKRAAEQRAKQGFTTASEFALMNSFILDLAQEATSDPDFAVRLVGGLFVTAPGFDELAPRLANYETELFHIPFVKTWTDGSAQGGTAHYLHGYHDKSFADGAPRGTQEEFNAQVLKMYKLGLWPGIHANGDGAVETAINAIEYAQKNTNAEIAKSIRPQIIHVQVAHQDQIERMAKLGAEPTFFTGNMNYWGDLSFETIIGPERIKQFYPMADAINAGLKPTIHCDFPVTPVDALGSMCSAVTRKSPSGRILGADQAITPYQALEAFTINAAYQFGMEKDAGSLEVGKYADLTILDHNPLKVEPDMIRKIEVLATFCDGRVTYANVAELDNVERPNCH